MTPSSSRHCGDVIRRGRESRHRRRNSRRGASRRGDEIIASYSQASVASSLNVAPLAAHSQRLAKAREMAWATGCFYSASFIIVRR